MAARQASGMRFKIDGIATTASSKNRPCAMVATLVRPPELIGGTGGQIIGAVGPNGFVSCCQCKRSLHCRAPTGNGAHLQAATGQLRTLFHADQSQATRLDGFVARCVHIKSYSVVVYCEL